MQYKCGGKVPLFIIVGIAICGLLVGCSSTPPTVVEKPFRGRTLTVAVPPAPEELLQMAVRGWQARHTATVQFVPFDLDKGPSKPAEVWIFPSSQLSRWITAGKVKPLPESLTRRDADGSWSGLLPVYRDYLATWDLGQKASVPHAVPVLGEAPVLCLRSDLYASEEHRQAYKKATGQDLSRPQSWADLLRQATYFHKAGFPFPALRDTPFEVERLFGQVAAGYDRRPLQDTANNPQNLEENVLALFQDLATGEPRLERPGFVHGLRLLQALQQSRLKGDGKDPEELFRTGQAALCLCEMPWVLKFQKTDSKVRDLFDVLPLPGAEKHFHPEAGPQSETEYRQPNRMPYLGAGSYVAVLSGEGEQPEMAASLLAHLLDRETSTALIQTPATAIRVVRVEQLEDRVRWDLLGLTAERTTAARQALRVTLDPPSLKNPALALRMPEANQYRDALVKHLRRALLDGAEARDCLAAATRDWRTIDEALGKDVARANARRSVGLRP